MATDCTRMSLLVKSVLLFLPINRELLLGINSAITGNVSLCHIVY